MEYWVASHTDVGIVKNINQDSLLYISADTDFGPILLCVICDGMGGLSQGELASATLVRAFERWFKDSLPFLLSNDGTLSLDVIRSEWNSLILEANKLMFRYGDSRGTHIGTTVTAMLFFGDDYFIVNVGDSRAYEFDREMKLMTKDHTYVQRQMDLGRMTYEQAMSDPNRNMLLQCVGASEVLVPDYFYGRVRKNAIYMLCSDGFRHLITPEEMFFVLRPVNNSNEIQMQDNLVLLTERNKERRERDNISAILIKTIEKESRDVGDDSDETETMENLGKETIA